jgi:hypothetical protein
MLYLHSTSLALGALTAAAGFTLVGALIRVGTPAGTWLAWLGAAVLGGWALRTLGLPGVPFPRSHWQVPEHWRTGMPPQFTISAYGYLLGLGFLTDVIVPAYWFLVLLTAADGGFAAIALGWLAYAIARIAVTVRATRRVAACPVDPTDSRLDYAWERRLTRGLTAGMLATSAAALVAAAG